MSATSQTQAPPATHTGHSALATDLLAGITTGIISLPQGMAFAVIANVPPQHGLYAMIIPTIVAALIRSSPFLITGATNTSALVIGSLIASMSAAHAYNLGPVEIMVVITLMMGVIQVVAGLLRFGGIGRYVSNAVLTGFTFGAAILIISGQIKNVLGIDVRSQPLFIDEVTTLFSRLSDVNARAIVLAALSLVIVAICARMSKMIPGALIAIVASAAVAAGAGWNVPLLGEVPRTLPAPMLPTLSARLISEVSGASLAVAVLGMVEAISIGKALSARARVKFYANQELVAKGAGNVVGAFFGCMPTSASWTRSALNLQMGATTRWVGVIAGVTVLVFMLALAPWAAYVPKASLGIIVIWIAAHMFDFRAAAHVWRWSRRDAAVMLITLLAILVMEIQYAIYLGVVASLILLIHRTGRLHMVEMLAAGERQFMESEIDTKTGASPVVLLQLEGDLFFGVVDELEERLQQIREHGAKVIIIRMKRTHGIDASASDALADFAEQFREKGGRLILCGLKPDMLAQLQRSRLATAIGKENLFPTEPNAFGSVQKAIANARSYLQVAAAETIIRRSPTDPYDAWAYSI